MSETYLNIAAYRFVPIDDVGGLAQKLHAWSQDEALLGTILVAPEGINLFLAGYPQRIQNFAERLRADARFASLRIKTSQSDAQPFARLKVKCKTEIIAFRREGAMPPSTPEHAISAAELRRWIASGQDDRGRRLVLLDTRNREEVAYGTFKNALTLPIDNFVDLPEALAPHRDDLRDATVVSFCTGGVRCEKLLPWLRADGMRNLLQLEGGILAYFEQVGGEGYEGECFVFDERIALDPRLRPRAKQAASNQR